jgi:hypothetical protein
MSLMQFDVGVRFEVLGTPHGTTAATTDQEATTKRHWALIFTSRKPEPFSIRVELRNTNGDISMPLHKFDEEVYVHPIGTFKGVPDDIDRIIAMHPMRGTKYSAAFNNCQHWVATALVYLQALADKTPDRHMRITNQALYDKVLRALKKSGTSLYNRRNLLFMGAQSIALGSMGGAMVAAGVAAEATTVVTTTVAVPAAGIAGWFGATTTATVATVAPAACATAGLVALPIIGVAGIASGIAVLAVTMEWKDKTMFLDPRRHGLPAETSFTPLAGSSSSSSGSGLLDFSSQSSSLASASAGGMAVGSVAAACSAPVVAAVAAPVVAVGAVAAVGYGLAKVNGS